MGNRDRNRTKKTPAQAFRRYEKRIFRRMERRLFETAGSYTLKLADPFPFNTGGYRP